MTKGKEWIPEWRQCKDRFTGVNISQLTNYAGHSNHLYFTENGWYDNGNKLLFHSDRNNQTNLFSIDIQSGKIIQLTNHNRTYDSLPTCLHPDGTKAFFQKSRSIIEIDLETLEERVVYERNENYVGGNINCTADGQYIITCEREDLSESLDIDLGKGYVGHRELMEAKPYSRIMQISINTSGSRVIFEEENFVRHINTSPKLPNIITFCHEGPWQLVDHRIWGLDINSGEVWKIRERTETSEMVGHEFWHDDGETIGYHGFRQDGTGFFGKINYKNHNVEEVEFPFRNWHAHSFGFSKVVVDGKGSLDKMIVWQQKNGEFTKPKVLCEHRCSFHVQKVHAHPRFSPDGKKILFTSDKDGYGNLYLVDLPEHFDELPDFE